jgi:hypothetical protein
VSADLFFGVTLGLGDSFGGEGKGLGQFREQLIFGGVNEGFVLS